jgi:DNA-binding transcriptional MocR family regulator
VHNYNEHGKSSGFAFLDSLVPSYLSIDTEGRVVRLDTFSKTIAPGCRLGWLTAQPRIVERILRIAETTTQQPSGFVQSMVAELIMGRHGGDCDSKADAQDASGWKVDGWVRWLEGLRGQYERRMQDMCTVLEEGKYIVVEENRGQHRTLRVRNLHRESIDEWEIVNKIQMYDFHFPRGGICVWIRLCLETHPLWSQVDAVKLSAALWKHLTKKPYLCLAAPGWLFAPTRDKVEEASSYFRLCFAAVEVDDVSRITHDFVEGCRNFWQITDVGDIDDSLDL